MRHLHLEPVGGISGDMILSLMVDIGFKPSILSKCISDLIGKKVEIEFEEIDYNFLKGKRLKEKKIFFNEMIKKKSDLKHILKKIEVKEDIKIELQKMFEILFEEERKVHSKKNVYLHEIENLDTLIDLLGFLLAKDFLKISSFSVGAIPLGNGFVETSHGKISVPAPLVINLLKNFLVIPQKGSGETVTPTGALIISHFFKPKEFSHPILFEKLGSGFGQREIKGIPNVLKGYLGLIEKKEAEMIEIKVNLDDCSGQLSGHLMEILLKNGAKDVIFYPVIMKKSRPGIVLEVLCESNDFEILKELIFKESTTLGMRYKKVNREVLEREILDVKTPYGKIPLKLGRLNGKVIQASFEYEALKKISEEKKIPLKEMLLKINPVILNYLEKN